MIWINLPHIRDSVFCSFRQLADKEMQLREWTTPGYNHYWGCMLHYDIFEDFDMAGMYNPESKNYSLVNIFYSTEEVEQAYAFGQFFDALITEIGEEKNDEAYLNHPQWPKVWSWSKEIYDIMESNNKKYKFWPQSYKPFEINGGRAIDYLKKKNREAGNYFVESE